MLDLVVRIQGEDVFVCNLRPIYPLGASLTPQTVKLVEVPLEIAEKLAMLKLTEESLRIPGVGRRFSTQQDIFIIEFGGDTGDLEIYGIKTEHKA